MICKMMIRSRRWQYLTVILIMGNVLPANVWANGPPIQSDTAFVVGLQGGAIRSFFKDVRKSTLLQNGKKIADPMDSQMSAQVIPVMIPYEVIPNRFVAGAGIPYMQKELQMTKAGVRTTLSNEGLGDLTVFGKYALYQRDKGSQTTRFTTKVEVKLPTAKATSKDASGALLPIRLQLGTGATDITLGGIMTRLWKRLGVNSGVHYIFKTEGKGIQLGNVLKYDVAFAYRVWPKVYEVYPSPQWNVFVEWNGAVEQKQKAQGQTVANSGGHTLFLSPGLQYIGGRTWLLELSYQLPVMQELNGVQLGTDRVILAGFRWLIG